MTREELLEAIGRVDDDLIQEAEDCRLPVGRHRFTHWRPLAGGLAACLVLAAVLYLPFGMSGGGDNTTSGAAAFIPSLPVESAPRGFNLVQGTADLKSFARGRKRRGGPPR